MVRKFESHRLSRRAEIDLADIYAYTVRHWSVDQAIRYVTDIREAIEGLVMVRKSATNGPRSA